MKMESMRQIKFKGNSRDTKNWVYGSLVKTPFGTFIEWYEDSVCNKVEIDPSTVCQYTGLKDSKGQDIWEHDILKSQDGVMIEVVYSKGSFMMQSISKYGHLVENPLCYFMKDKKTVDCVIKCSKFDKEV